MFFFTCFIIFGSFAMLSILTGVISESMIEKGNNHKDRCTLASNTEHHCGIRERVRDRPREMERVSESVRERRRVLESNGKARDIDRER